MHIGFRTSGGRGEYEVVSDHSGYSARELENWTFFMRWPDGVVRDTGLWLDPAGSGKPRLRSLAAGNDRLQIGRVVAAMLLAPDPTRTLPSTGTSEPILQRKHYVVSKVGFGAESEFSSLAERVTFVPSWVQVRNQNHEDLVGVNSRWERIQRLYDVPDLLPLSVAPWVQAHQEYLFRGHQVDAELITIVQHIMDALVHDEGVSYVRGADPLTALERQVQPPRYEGPSLPPPHLLGQNEPDISARSAREYRKVRARGSEGRRFARAVNAAYDNTCMFCGVRLAGFEGLDSGIDAAHILAWSQYDLDVVSNGMSLCKLHHWSFDAGVFMPVPYRETYQLRFTCLADVLDNHSRDILGNDGQIVPRRRLPDDKIDWPSRKYLERLYADLEVEFASTSSVAR